MFNISKLAFSMVFSLFMVSCFLYPPETFENPDRTKSYNGPEIHFSQESGYYSGSQSISLSCSEESLEIYYTSDGSVVALEAFTVVSTDSADNRENTAAQIYSSPISISDNTLIRAQAFKGETPVSQEFSNLYLLNEDTTLPVVSLVVDPRDFWDHNTGIYVTGPNDGTYPTIGSYGDQNYFQDWERPISFEFFEDTAHSHSLELESRAGVKIFGGWSRDFAQKSLALFARPEYGSSSFNHDFFQGTAKNAQGTPITSFTSLVLRSSGDDWWRTMFRDGFLQSLADNMNIDRQAYRPAIVYLNGQYWGIHNIREKVNEDYLAAHYPGVDPRHVDILAHYDSRIVEGSDQHFKMVLDYAQNNDLSQTDHYNQIDQWIDMDNFRDYSILELFINNTDWPVSNIKYWRPQSSTGKWRFILYDTDPGFGGKDWDPIPNAADYNTLSYLMSDNDADSDFRTLFVRIIENDDFRTSFINRFEALLAGDFAVATLESKVDNMADAISLEINDHLAAWDNYMENPWNTNVSILRDYASPRHSHWSAAGTGFLDLFEADFAALIRNGDFGDNGAYWSEGWTEDGTTAAFTFGDFADNTAGGTVTALDGTPVWDDIVICYQEGINLAAGSTYQLSYNAWVESGTTSIALAIMDSSWTVYSDTANYWIQSIDTNSGTFHTLSCTMSVNDANAQVMFFAGMSGVNSVIHIDNVTLTQL